MLQTLEDIEKRCEACQKLETRPTVAVGTVPDEIVFNDNIQKVILNLNERFVLRIVYVDKLAVRKFSRNKIRS